MNYADHVAAAVASIPPLTQRQLRIVAANLAQTSSPGARSAKNTTRAAHHSVDRKTH